MENNTPVWKFKSGKYNEIGWMDDYGNQGSDSSRNGFLFYNNWRMVIKESDSIDGTYIALQYLTEDFQMRESTLEASHGKGNHILDMIKETMILTFEKWG